jgi:hypothetical protein
LTLREGEEANFLALNLAHDLVAGSLRVDQARRRYTLRRRRPDELTVAETMLHKPAERWASWKRQAGKADRPTAASSPVAWTVRLSSRAGLATPSG